MPVSIFQIINFTIIFVVLIFLLRYAWGMFFDDSYEPAEWAHQKKQGKISRDLLKLEKNYADKVRFFNWWFQVERLKKENIPGDFAELGVYKGESAGIIHRMAPERKLHLFDTFEGFKEKDLKEEIGKAATYSARNFADTNVEKVRRFIGGNENVVFHPGYFPESAVSSQQSAVRSWKLAVDDDLENSDFTAANGQRQTATGFKFAFVNLDADLYNPTKAGLEYFYPRLSPGGVIIIHDYNHKWEGVIKAVDEFVKTIPESLIMLPDMEGSVMIVKNFEF